MSDVGVLVLAAGRGARLGAGSAKAVVPLGGRPLAAHSIEAAAGARGVGEIVLVGDAGELAPVLDALSPAARALVARTVEGGDTRQASCAHGLAALSPKSEVVLVHDAARPFAGSELFERVADAARRTGAALAAVPAVDTLKRAKDGRVVETLDRGTLWAAQTPQGARRALFEEAHAAAARDGIAATDDVALVERLGHAVEIVEGVPHNRKITDRADLAWAEAWLAR